MSDVAADVAAFLAADTRDVLAADTTVVFSAAKAADGPHNKPANSHELVLHCTHCSSAKRAWSSVTQASILRPGQIWA